MEINELITQINVNFTTVFWQVTATLIFIFTDVIVGVICAIIRKNLDSQKMREGLLRKMLLIIVIGLSFVVQEAFFNMTLISKIVCGYIIIMEIISIFENMKKAGVDLGKLGELLKIKNNEENTINLVVKKEDEEKDGSEK